jgi:hypothetical protein
MAMQEQLADDSPSLAIKAIEAIEAVIAVQEQLDWEEIKRIPDWLRSQTFFGEFDLWLLQTIEPADDRICFGCTVLDKIVFTGLELRSAFPWLEVIDANTIMAKVHPNCRCKLLRITNPLDYITISW